MRSKPLGLTLIVFLTPLSGAFSADRYFYYDGSQGYYCEKPPAITEHCYIVRDEPGVIRVNGFSVLAPSEAERLCTTVVSTPSDDCCNTTPTGDCLPTLIGPCRCPGKPNNTPISFDEGDLKKVCDTTPFYAAIGTIKGEIPVPQVCVTAVEEYQFRTRILSYDCDEDVEPTGEGCDDLDCDHADCKSKCRVKSCEVFNKRDVCEKTCKLCPRRGDLLIAIRRDGRTADVFIGQVGATDFPEYPRNLTVIRGRSESQIRRLLNNPAISFRDIINTSTTTDLLSVL